MNDLGEVVGTSETGPGPSRAPFIWSLANSTSEIESSTSLKLTVPSGINSSQQIIGSGSDGFVGGPVLWQDGTAYLLEDLMEEGCDWVLIRANAINENGWITGIGHSPGGNYYTAFLMIPDTNCPWGNTCPADFNHDCFVDGIDYDRFEAVFVVGSTQADINCDGFVDGIDYDSFQTAFETGC
jgi:hypothetical protein